MNSFRILFAFKFISFRFYEKKFDIFACIIYKKKKNQIKGFKYKKEPFFSRKTSKIKETDFFVDPSLF